MVRIRTDVCDQPSAAGPHEYISEAVDNLEAVIAIANIGDGCFSVDDRDIVCHERNTLDDAVVGRAGCFTGEEATQFPPDLSETAGNCTSRVDEDHVRGHVLDQRVKVPEPPRLVVRGLHGANLLLVRCSTHFDLQPAHPDPDQSCPRGCVVPPARLLVRTRRPRRRGPTPTTSRMGWKDAAPRNTGVERSGDARVPQAVRPIRFLIPVAFATHRTIRAAASLVILLTDGPRYDVPRSAHRWPGRRVYGRECSMTPFSDTYR